MTKRNLAILVVEDDVLARTVLTKHLSDHRVQAVSDVVSARRELQSRSYDLCFIDLVLGKEDPNSGLELIADAASCGAYPVVMSGHDSEEIVERAYTLGCKDFYSKGNEASNAQAVINRFIAASGGESQSSWYSSGFVTNDAKMRAFISEALRFAPTDLPMLILGPSGTGKTSLAKLLHERSGRDGPFVSINCAAYSDDLLEAELFGYRKGAFSGASDNRKGQLLLADRGTLFLDEVGSMSLKMQTKLLKAIEEHAFYAVGSDRLEHSKFRVISATLDQPDNLIASGTMRFDFFQRINGYVIELTPLASRTCDIWPLIDSFTRGGRRLSFTPAAKALLLQYEWPGNVRELRRIVQRLAAGTEGQIPADAVERILSTATTRPTSGLLKFSTDTQYNYALHYGLQKCVDEVVDSIIARSLSENEGKKARVMEALKISTRMVYASIERSTKKGALS